MLAAARSSHPLRDFSLKKKTINKQKYFSLPKNISQKLLGAVFYLTGLKTDTVFTLWVTGLAL